ncbi:MAG: hypothetical protein H0T88_01025 [Lysobacter sp.]|nr:hypothetical protein [Lysobacter sp.]
MGLAFGDDQLLREAITARCAQRAVQRCLDSRSPPCRSQSPELQEKARPDPLEVLGGD